MQFRFEKNVASILKNCKTWFEDSILILLNIFEYSLPFRNISISKYSCQMHSDFLEFSKFRRWVGTIECHFDFPKFLGILENVLRFRQFLSIKKNANVIRFSKILLWLGNIHFNFWIFNFDFENGNVDFNHKNVISANSILQNSVTMRINILSILTIFSKK